jgi:hypothetical protein
MQLQIQLSNSPDSPNTVIASASEAIHRVTRKQGWIASLALAMTSKYTTAFSRREASELCRNHLPQIEGAGNAGRTMRPQPCVQNEKAHKRSHHGHTGFTRHSPRNGFTAYSALSSVTGLSCHRRRRNDLPRT